ncbi:hypothetical protein BGZ65_001358 [Modicella reniformis]|uniref:Uncharacterized protein n=1 Tax=Modicella reniformis TaxID=1440133 RepID=A0A9P6LTE6_9FUNG|nr:hypothetical protein BGZ65_001358 [Modicella reniformis]
MKVNRVPIPIIGKTILAFFRDGPFKNKGLVCEADGNRIRCYVSSEPDAVQVTKSEGLLVDRTYVQRLGLGNGFEDDKQYELKTRQHGKMFPCGGGSQYWVLGVELIEESEGNKKVVFSFVPEPWMRVSTKDVGIPDDLMNVYFLPNGAQFVVAGMQTLQIWNFPTDKFNYFHLDFIWSHPKMIGDPYNPYGRAYKSELVGEYYHCLPQPKICMDEITGHIKVDFELRNKKYHHVIIPAARDSKTRSTFLYCARSIHLLAAAYAYSHNGSKKASSRETVTFEAHAEAIARFTLGHINMLLSKKDYNTLRLIYHKRRDTGATTLRWNNDSLYIPCSTDTANASAIPVSVPVNDIVARAHTTSTIPDRVISARLRSLTLDEDSRNQCQQVVNILTLLLNRHDLRDLNRVFIEGLLNSDSSGWIPHTDKSLNPIASVIKDKDVQLLKILIDYCIQCAKTYHPAYLAPVEQCLVKLLDHYPDIVANLFRSTSYIPAHNQDYVASQAISASNRFEDILDGNKYPVFILRSQLPTTTPLSFFFLNSNDDLHQGSESRFPPKQNEQPTHKKRKYKIYVSPFQFRPIVPLNKKSQKTQRKCLPKRHRQESVFNHIKGKDDFDNPAIVAIIRFKWYRFVIEYWLARFVLVLVFFLFMIAITTKQIKVSSVKRGQILAADEIAARYLPGWRPVIMMAILFGLMLLAYEVWQMAYSPKKYFRYVINLLAA